MTSPPKIASNRILRVGAGISTILLIATVALLKIWSHSFDTMPALAYFIAATAFISALVATVCVIKLIDASLSQRFRR